MTTTSFLPGSREDGGWELKVRVVVQGAGRVVVVVVEEGRGGELLQPWRRRCGGGGVGRWCRWPGSMAGRRPCDIHSPGHQMSTAARTGAEGQRPRPQGTASRSCGGHHRLIPGQRQRWWQWWWAEFVPQWGGGWWVAAQVSRPDAADAQRPPCSLTRARAPKGEGRARTR